MTTKEQLAIARCWAEIDLTQLRQNLLNARALLSHSGAALYAVVKADAYGCKARVLAPYLQEQGVTTFCVAAPCEALELCAAGRSVLVMGRSAPAELPALIESGAVVTLTQWEDAQALSQAALALGRTARAQIKLETGLNRLGFSPEDALRDVPRISHLPGLRIEGLFTHLALRDAASDAAQHARLVETVAALRQAGVSLPTVHALDSIGMVRYPTWQADAVRLGAWLYGVCPARYPHPEQCRLIVSFKTRVARLAWIEAGECVGYDEEHPVARRTHLATLSCGYADGVARLHAVGEVELRGQRAPILGLVCMDQMSVDVTDIPEARVGDEVTLLGGSIGINEYAAWGKLNRNEALCRIGRRVPRLYREGGRVRQIEFPLPFSAPDGD